MILRIHPERRRGLGAAGQRHQHARGDVALGEAHLLRARAVDVHAQFRLVECLLDAQVGDAGNMLDPAHQCVGVGAILLALEADHLDVDRCRQAEVEDLADDVGRQEGERGAGKLAAATRRAIAPRIRRWADGPR